MGLHKYSTKVSVVMPAYNEGKNIYINALKTCELLEEFLEDFEIVLVNDGSKDDTKKEIEKASMMDSRIKLVSYDQNAGKGHAIKLGVENSTGEYIAFLDADLDISPNHLKDFMHSMEENRADVVIGSKMHKDSKLEYPVARKIMSLGYYLILSLLFRLKVKDTQTGVKLFKSCVIKPIIELVQTTGYAYDIEILAAASRRKAIIIERPIELVYTRTDAFGRIKFKDIWRVFNDTISIFNNLTIHKRYDIKDTEVIQKN